MILHGLIIFFIKIDLWILVGNPNTAEEGEVIVKVQRSHILLRKEDKDQVSELKRILTSIPNNTWWHNVQSAIFKFSSKSLIFWIRTMTACWPQWIYVRPFVNMEDINLEDLLSMSPCPYLILMMAVKLPSKNLWS